ncbi:sugar transferase [Prochlorococcus marinus]|uniref:Undecaprenyl-phosphate galactosephosphotransferase n=1 Tax=Prochlorococcus marinus str. GP2 TaxID=59925 RepID=A0A0A1ZE86_PROMR|nr:sugar transferase [Prochlorococcus marinus]KGF86484.1 Undecaprenyl-phosphate galactosephosphotransferase [Prochlorococcus marinus str. GP2]
MEFGLKSKINYYFFKRLFDIFFSLIIIIIFCPLLLLISILIKATSKGPIIYKGKRVGYHGKIFFILKFRTMHQNAEIMGGYSTSFNDPRLTKIGRILRRYKIDELPQFFNVLLGEMSITGPRPQVLYYTDKYNNEEKKILDIKPGITDLSSIYFNDMDKILGNKDADFIYEKEIEPIKNKLRLRYLREHNFFFDLRILIETAFGILGLKNITGLLN